MYCDLFMSYLYRVEHEKRICRSDYALFVALSNLILAKPLPTTQRKERPVENSSLPLWDGGGEVVNYSDSNLRLFFFTCSFSMVRDTNV